MQRSTSFLILALCAVLSSCAGYRNYEEGREAMIAGDPERALAKLEQAAKASPDNKSYRDEYERTKSQVVAKLLSDADLFRGSGDLAKAEAHYRKVLRIDPNNVRATKGLALIQNATQSIADVASARIDLDAGDLDKAEATVREVLKRDPDNPGARDVSNQISERRAAQKGQQAAELKGPFSKPITLEFRDATLKSVFEVISRTAGLNFVFDRDVRSDTKINIFVRNTSLDDVVKLILTTNQLDRKMLNENSVLIYPNTPAKQKEYRELVVRSFYLANADVKQAVNLVKGMVKSQDVFIDEKLNLLVVKDTPEAMSVVEKLVRSLDLAEPEVMLELEVLEVSSNKLQQLGVQYPSTISFGNPSASTGTDTSGGTGTGTGTASAPANIRLTDSLVAFTANPPIVLNLLGQDSDAKVLANPRIRVKNREKAKVHIGSRVPVVTTTSTANVGVSSSVSYLDVGLKLDVEPNIYLRDEVAIKVGLEVSNITRTLDISGTRAYELGTRNTATVLQIRDGETQILAGLISDEDRRSANKIPGLGDIPVLGRLFSNNNDNRIKTEIVLLITPRIVRSLKWPRNAIADQPVGTDAAIGTPPLRISATSAGGLTMGPAGGPGGGISRPSLPGSLPTPQPVPGAPGQGVPSVATPMPAPGAAVPGAQAAIPAVPGQNIPGAPVPGASQDNPTGDAPALLVAAPLAAKAGTDVMVSLGLPPGTSAVSARLELTYDPTRLEPVGTSAASPGRLPVKVDGSASVRFKVIGQQGRTQVRTENIVGLDAAGNATPLQAPQAMDMTITP
jgi:general secretion pathway protein D